MSKPQEMTPLPEHVVLGGGTFVPIQLRDGTARTVKVELVSMRNMQKLQLAWTNEPEELRLYCPELTQEDLDRVTPESWGALVTEGRRLNSGPFVAYFNRTKEAVRLMRGGMPREEAPSPVPTSS